MSVDISLLTLATHLQPMWFAFLPENSLLLARGSVCSFCIYLVMYTIEYRHLHVCKEHRLRDCVFYYKIHNGDEKLLHLYTGFDNNFLWWLLAQSILHFLIMYDS